MKQRHVSVPQMDEAVERVHNTDEVKGSGEYGYTAKILEGEAYCDLKIEVDLPLQMPILVAEEPIRRFLYRHVRTNVASSRKLLKILQPCFSQ